MDKQLLDIVCATPGEIKKLRTRDLEKLADEARAFILESVPKTGGHLASNLGVVELTVALHAAFDFPNDKIIFDVGHQAYVHKMLSGRKDAFDTLRLYGGLSGFPKRQESEYDSFGTGHSGTAISAALGMARSNAILKQKRRVVAVVGDGALTGGMCFEAINDAGRERGAKTGNLIVVLNDNEMSISKNVGALSESLSRIRSAPGYFKLREGVYDVLTRIPIIGRFVAELISKIKAAVKRIFLGGVVFEGLGFRYIGPVDGHDTAGLRAIFSGVSKMRGPVLVHVITRKGKGCDYAERDPEKYHGVNASGAREPALRPAPSARSFEPLAQSFEPLAPTFELSAPSFEASAPTPPHASPEPLPLTPPHATPTRDMSSTLGETLVKLAGADKTIVAITAAMADGTGLSAFEARYKDRFFDVGIAEQHAVTLAAGMALTGLRPVVAIYSTFLQRAYDQVLHDVCLQNAHVVFALDRAGVSGRDGETHQGVYDMAYLRHMPNLEIIAPSCCEELTSALRYAVFESKGPVAIRYPKDAVSREDILRLAKTGERAPTLSCAKTPSPAFKKGVGELLRSGDDVTIVAVGATVPAALVAASELEREGARADVISARFVKPIDVSLILRSVKKTGGLVVIEDGVVSGGFGSSVLESLASRGLCCEASLVGFPDEPIPQGGREELAQIYGVSAAGAAEAARALVFGGLRSRKRAFISNE